ncbi:hypothetical protein CBR_g38931 [Chara braunii]|uniref:Nudix hydrolase domain-containing protein n=1 Tax=Chara braunii TaxID=69332 RepID=A0A388K0M7_CHABU|nr:hypothetical protein CBR_g38931 [Chara braunii]|eukprot:GBG63620.1 hypothetical protein CBR_g38931 [Chara braunii]
MIRIACRSVPVRLGAMVSQQQAVQAGYAASRLPRGGGGGGGVAHREAAVAGSHGGGGGGGGSGMKPSVTPSRDLLEDLCSRFILNAPEEDLQSFERILFLVEQAHWFYEDFTREEKPCLRHLSLREFTALVFQYCTSLRKYLSHIDDIYNDFTTYKIRVPVSGAIILNQALDKCLLVKGYKPGASWGFPKGKKSKDEEDDQCAIREVEEETGFDISGLLKPEEYLEVSFGQQRTRLYIVPGVDEKTSFAPQTKKEISEVSWHRIDELPVASNVAAPAARAMNGNKYFMVWPFISKLRTWIANYAKQRNGILKAKDTSQFYAGMSAAGYAVEAFKKLPRRLDPLRLSCSKNKNGLARCSQPPQPSQAVLASPCVPSSQPVLQSGHLSSPLLSSRPVHATPPVHSSQPVVSSPPLPNLQHVHCTQSVNSLQPIHSLQCVQPVQTVQSAETLVHVQPLPPVLMGTSPSLLPLSTVFPVQPLQSSSPVQPAQPPSAVHLSIVQRVPGLSFRNFHFNRDEILKGLECRLSCS